MNNLLNNRVAVGIKFNEINLAVITTGSKNQATCIPKNENVRITPSIIYFNSELFLLKLSPVCFRFFLIDPVISINVPNGHTQPQKNLPNIKINIGIITANNIPGRNNLSDIEVKSIRLISVLTRNPGEIIPRKGYVVDQSI